MNALERAEGQGLSGLWSGIDWHGQEVLRAPQSFLRRELSRAGLSPGRGLGPCSVARLSAGWFSTALSCAEFFSSSQFRLSASDTDAQRTYTKRRSLNTGNGPM